MYIIQTEGESLHNSEDYTLYVEENQIISFVFLRNHDDVMEQWYAFMQQQTQQVYESPGYLLLLTDMQRLDVLPVAHIIQRIKEQLRQSAHPHTARHALIVPADTNIDVMENMFKTLPDKADIKFALFLPDEADDARAWLQSERQVIHSSQ